MIDITTYTSYDEVRAALGVSDDELSNDTLALEVYGAALNVEMYELNPQFSAMYTTLAEGSPDATQQLFLDYAKLFCTYSVAQQLCAALPMFALKGVGDSKATAERFAADPYQKTIADIKGRLDAYKNKVIELINILNPSASTSSPSTPFIMMGKSTPTFNPVTGA